MKKHHYPFARIFIRLAIGLALLTLLAGVGYIILSFTSMQAAIQAQKYRPDPELMEQAERLQRLYLGTRERIAQTLEDSTLPASLPEVDFAAALQNAQRARGTGQPEALLQLAEQTQSSVNALKEFHVASFERAIESLRQTLLQRVRDLQEQFGQAAPPTTTTAAPAPTPSASAASPARFRIFNDPATNDRNRLRTLEEIRSFLNNLREQSQREESLDQIRRAQIFLTRAEAMLDQLQTAATQPRTGTDSPTSVEQTAEQQMVSRAEQLAGELQEVQQIIRQSLYESWQVDDAISRLRVTARSDMAAAESSQEQIRHIQAASFSRMGTTLVIALAIAFLILVLADFLRAFLNLSVNSDHFQPVLDGLPPTPASPNPPTSAPAPPVDPPL